jgi:hypothetical protein
MNAKCEVDRTMTPEERIEMAELHDLYDKHTVVWCNPEYKTAFLDESVYCATCGMPLYKKTLVNSSGQDMYSVGVGLRDRRMILSSNRPFAKHLADMRDKHEAADIMAALLLWHLRVQGMENPPMYYCTLAANIGANSPELQRVVRDCGNWLAYDYLANFPDEKEEIKMSMRAAALKGKDPRLAYNMAVFIDLEPRQDTWDVVKQFPTLEPFANYTRWKGYPRYRHIVLK